MSQSSLTGGKQGTKARFLSTTVKHNIKNEKLKPETCHFQRKQEGIKNHVNIRLFFDQQGV
jgi:hypothetical protein